jgi:hypothetical protein
MLSASQALTIFAEIDRDKRALLDARLKQIGDHPRKNTLFRPGELPDTHFTRFLVIDDERGELPAVLAWEANHDGYRDDYLAQVAREAPAIDKLFECCVGYPGAADPTWLDWMRARAHRPHAFYCGYRGIARRQVVNDRQVHDALRAIVDRDRVELSELPPVDIQRELRERLIHEHPELDVAPQSDDTWRWRAAKVLAILIAIPAGLLALPILRWWWRTLLRKEKEDAGKEYDRPVHAKLDVAAVEDKFTQNQLTHVVDVKPGFFRLFTLWAVLTVIHALARVYYVNGDLGGITSIHFARWVILLDKRRVAKPRHRLIFFSNYDGSWDSYLGEFIDRASGGLTAVWQHTADFPKSERLKGKGAEDEEAFKQWTRDHQIATQVWWTGVPDSTVQNVRDDVWIRRRLDRRLSPEELRTWLSKL